MKIRTNDGYYYSGMPVEIVEQMRAGAQKYRTYHSLEEYMRVTARRAKFLQRKTIRVKGQVLKKRCKNFLQTLIKKGLARRIYTVGIWVLTHQNQFWGDSFQEIVSKMRTSDVRINPYIKSISMENYLLYLQNDLQRICGVEENLILTGVSLETQCEHLVRFMATSLPIAGFVNEANEDQITLFEVHHHPKSK